MEDNFGAIVRKVRERKRLTIESLSQRSGISEENLHNFENNRLVPLPEEVEALIRVLEANIDLASSIRRSAGTHLASPADIPGIQVFTEAAGGLHPWAQTIFAAELSTEGPRKSVLGYLSARVRPIQLTLKQYQWDGVSDLDLQSIKDLLIKRRASWLKTLEVYKCQDIYPKVWIERYFQDRLWFGRTLSADDVAQHLAAVESELTHHPNYEIGLLTNEELYFNFIIQQPYVLVEGGYEIEPKPPSRFVGGLRITAPQIVRSFELEFDRMWNSIPSVDRERDKIIEWFRTRRQHLEDLNSS